MPEPEGFLPYLVLELAEREGFDRVPDGHPFRARLGPAFSDVLLSDRHLAGFVQADDLPLDQCRACVEVFEQLRLARQLPGGLHTILVTFVHRRRCPPERLEELIRLRPSRDDADWLLESRVLDLDAQRAASRAGWFGRARPALGVFADILRHWAQGSAPPVTADDVARAQDARLDQWRSFSEAVSGSRVWASYAVLALLVAVFVLTELAGGSLRGDVLLRFGSKHNVLVRAGDWWRLVSACFLHQGLVHIFCNGLGIFMVGRDLERCFGGLRWLALYLLSGLAGSVASFLFVPAPSVGASGAVYGLLGAGLAIALFKTRTVPKAVRRRLLVGFGGMIALNLLLASALPFIDHAAHLGGLAGGFLLGGVFSLRDEVTGRPTSRVRTAAFGAVIAVFAVALGFAAVSAVRLGLDPLAFSTVAFFDRNAQMRFEAPAFLEPDENGWRGPGLRLAFESEPMGWQAGFDLDAGVARERDRLVRRGATRIEEAGFVRTGETTWTALDYRLSRGERGRVLLAVIAERLAILAIETAESDFARRLPVLERAAATVRKEE